MLFLLLMLARGRWRGRHLLVQPPSLMITGTTAGTWVLQRLRPRGSRSEGRRRGRGRHLDGAFPRTKTRGRRSLGSTIAATLHLCTAGRSRSRRCRMGTSTRWRRRRRRRRRSMGGAARARCDRCRRGRGRGNSGAAATGEMSHGGERQEERRGSPVDQHLGMEFLRNVAYPSQFTRTNLTHR